MSLGGPSKTIVVEPLRTPREAPEPRAPDRERRPPSPPVPREPAPA